MTTTQDNRSYSEFFSSGLRAIAATTYRRPSSVYSTHGIPGPSSSTVPNALKTSRRYSVLRNLARRTRTSSLSVSLIVPDTTTTTRKDRRSSIVGFPSRLLGRIANSADSRSLSIDRAPRQSTEEIIHRPRNYKSHEKCGPTIDPFDSSPFSSSFFTDCMDTPSLIPPRIPQSFLLLGESSTRHSYLHFPRRRERPMSVQSMPLPSQSDDRPSNIGRQAGISTTARGR
ncbi:hypothetical protein B0H10DRAFT_42335 [Mycena sp. CBHHK59/15]|nr:hypothetical protein B0H10DRAFT_42335 [Mycena sp. CBHHK59/15]